jgi:hypothetical protein
MNSFSLISTEEQKFKSQGERSKHKKCQIPFYSCKKISVRTQAVNNVNLEVHFDSRVKRV